MSGTSVFSEGYREWLMMIVMAVIAVAAMWFVLLLCGVDVPIVGPIFAAP